MAHNQAQWLQNLAVWGVPKMQSTGQNQKWATSGPSGDITPAVYVIPKTSERGVKIKSGRQWA